MRANSSARSSHVDWSRSAPGDPQSDPRAAAVAARRGDAARTGALLLRRSAVACGRAGTARARRRSSASSPTRIVVGDRRGRCRACSRCSPRAVRRDAVRAFLNGHRVTAGDRFEPVPGCAEAMSHGARWRRRACCVAVERAGRRSPPSSSAARTDLADRARPRAAARARRRARCAGSSAARRAPQRRQRAADRRARRRACARSLRARRLSVAPSRSRPGPRHRQRVGRGRRGARGMSAPPASSTRCCGRCIAARARGRCRRARRRARSRGGRSPICPSRCRIPEWLVERWLARYGFEAAERWCQFNNTPPELTVRRVRRRVGRELICRARGRGRDAADRAAFVADAIRLPPGTLGRLPPELRDDARGPGRRLAARGARGSAPRPASACSTSARRPAARPLLAARRHATGAALLVAATCARRGSRCCASHARAALGVRGAARARSTPARPCRSAPSSIACCSTRRARGSARCAAIPDLKWTRRPGRPRRASPASQDAMLDQAAAAVRPGGALVYATCSSEPEENEQVVERFLHRPSGFRRSARSCPAAVHRRERLLDADGLPADAAVPRRPRRVLRAVLRAAARARSTLFAPDAPRVPQGTPGSQTASGTPAGSSSCCRRALAVTFGVFFLPRCASPTARARCRCRTSRASRSTKRRALLAERRPRAPGRRRAAADPKVPADHVLTQDPGARHRPAPPARGPRARQRRPARPVVPDVVGKPERTAEIALAERQRRRSRRAPRSQTPDYGRASWSRRIRRPGARGARSRCSSTAARHERQLRHAGSHRHARRSRRSTSCAAQGFRVDGRGRGALSRPPAGHRRPPDAAGRAFRSRSGDADRVEVSR